MELYILPISVADDVPEELCRRLFPKRMAAAERFSKREDGKRSIAAGLLTAFVMGVKENEIDVNEWGKPSLKSNHVQFSLSHSGDYALLAVDVRAVGTDIQKQVPYKRGVAERMFTPEELEWMDEEPEERFFILWTLKESVIKLDGGGGLRMEDFSVLPIVKGGYARLPYGKVYGRTEKFRDCTIAVCTLHPIDEMPVRVLETEDLTVIGEGDNIITAIRV